MLSGVGSHPSTQPFAQTKFSNIEIGDKHRLMNSINHMKSLWAISIKLYLT